MNRLPEIVLFTCMIMGILINGFPENRLSNFSNLNSLLEIKYDTTGYIRLIEVDTFNLTIFPPSSGIQIYKDGIVFLSPSKNEKKMSPKFISFGTVEAYWAKLEDTTLGKHMIFSQISPFLYPCESITFSPDYNTMYFTKNSKKDKNEKIYLAKFISKSKKQSGWLSEKTPLDFCTDNSTYAYPTISSDGNILIFASDKQGSLGGMDLFITRKEGDKWIAPENLGKSINTAGNEIFPFLDSDNNLFFSSDGLPGYGGYDVFTCKFNGEAWDNPMNLSHRINSEKDDIAFTINKMDGKTAFYTKRHKSGKGEMQLFRIILNKEAVDSNLLTISNIFNGKPVLKASVTTMKEVAQVNRMEVLPAKTKPVIEETKKGSEIKGQQTKVIPESKVKPPEAKVVTIKPTISTPDDQKDIVIYRVQFLSSIKPQKENKIIINKETYNTYEYLYLGEYRYTIGEFRSVGPAAVLQSICRRSGYPQAFVVAFKNNTRSLDLKLFK